MRNEVNHHLWPRSRWKCMTLRIRNYPYFSVFRILSEHFRLRQKKIKTATAKIECNLNGYHQKRQKLKMSWNAIFSEWVFVFYHFFLKFDSFVPTTHRCDAVYDTWIAIFFLILLTQNATAYNNSTNNDIDSVMSWALARNIFVQSVEEEEATTTTAENTTSIR